MNLLLLSILLFVTALLSGLSIYILKPDNKNYLKLLLSFSGAFLFSIAVINILPEIFSHGDNHYIGIYIIIGFLTQLLLDYITHGVEHGHTHNEHAHHHHSSMPYLTLMIGICIHSFLEGMPFVEAIDEHTRNAMFFGIVIHNIPIALVLMSLFIQSNMSKKNAITLLAIFALMTPLGALASNEFNYLFENSIENYLGIIMAIVVGIFLHVSTSILFESTEHHTYNRKKLITVVIGIATAILTSLGHAH
ncbi:MAG: ZIP family metal transporter [Bacteroidota bacterium]